MLLTFIAAVAMAAAPPGVEREDPALRFQRQYGASFRDSPFKTIDRLAQDDDPDASEMLEVIAAERASYRSSALGALEARLNKRKDLEALDALARHFNHSDPDVRRQVRCALEQFIGNHAIGAFDPLFLRDEVVPKLEELVRKAGPESHPEAGFWLTHLEGAIERWRREFSPEGYERRDKELAERRRREAALESATRERERWSMLRYAVLALYLTVFVVDWVNSRRDARP